MWLNFSLRRAFSVAAGIFPPRKTLVLFGARKGNWYMDCPQHLYEWVLENRPDIQPVWMTGNDEVYEKLLSQGRPVCHLRSRKAYLLLMQARLAVISYQLYDIARHPACIPDSLRIIFTGHGKSVKASSLAFRAGRSSEFKWLFRRAGQLIDSAMSTSPFITRLAAQANGLPEDRFVVTGYPRNDILVHPEPRVKKQWDDYLRGIEPDLVVLYAPTWRQRGAKTRFFPFEDFDKDELNRFLADRRILLLLRPHERDILNNIELADFLRELTQDSEWIRMCDQRVFHNVNHILSFVDVLVSDYSSIFNDFLLLDRPMVFIPYDYEDFAETQGFMYDYYDHLPGRAVGAQKEFLSSLTDIHDGKDPDRKKRQTLRDMIHTHTDGRATQRVVNILTEKLGLEPHEVPT